MCVCVCECVYPILHHTLPEIRVCICAFHVQYIIPYIHTIRWIPWTRPTWPCTRPAATSSHLSSTAGVWCVWICTQMPSSRIQETLSLWHPIHTYARPPATFSLIFYPSQEIFAFREAPVIWQIKLQCTATHCNILQHIATHCNTLQHTYRSPRHLSNHNVTHCNTLQRTSTHRNTLQHIATHCITLPDAPIIYQITCNALQRTSTHCNTRQHTATRCITLQHTATHCNTLTEAPVIFQITLQHTATHCNTLTEAPGIC